MFTGANDVNTVTAALGGGAGGSNQTAYVDEKVSTFGEKTPMKRPAQPEGIAPAYGFFASDADSSFISGVVLPAMGGQTIGG